MSKTRIFQVLKLNDMLPLLASAYEAGRLVPFIGAGMSRPKLASWQGFVENLEKHAALRPSSSHFDIRAGRAAAKLKNSHNSDEFITIVGESLRGDGIEDSEIPEQTRALAEIYWPLTISTNYDDLFYGACRQVAETRLRPAVLGRSPNDCKRVMAALVSPFDREIVWHIQGCVDGLHPGCRHSPFEDPAQRVQLQSELVIGHSEYRKVANTGIHFRRCFGEVFRSRSFFFLGSSLSEEYFWNLFGEMLELCGPSSVPHFAFLPKHDRIDVRFLAEQMNITVCQYDDHSQLPRWLGQLKQYIQEPKTKMSRWTVELERGSSLDIVPHASIPVPTAGSNCAVAVVVRPCTQGQFEVEQNLKELRPGFSGAKFKGPEHVVSAGAGLFAVRARTGDPNENDVVGMAVRELLRKLPPTCDTLHLHLPSEGGTVPPVYGFIEAARSFGGWIQQHETQLRLIAYVGPQVLLNLTAQQINLHELVMSRLIRFRTMVNPQHIDVGRGEHVRHQDLGAEPVVRVLYRKPRTRLRDVVREVLGEVEPDALKLWSLSLCPSPDHDKQRESTRTVDSVADRFLCDLGVVFGSVLTLDRVHRLPEPEPTTVQAALA